MDIHDIHYTRFQCLSQVNRRVVANVFFLTLSVGLLLAFSQACSSAQPTLTMPTHNPAPVATSTHRPTALPTVAVATPTMLVSVPLTPTVTAWFTGPVLTDVKFALDVDQAGQLIYPANEFVFGVTRVYVRFAYQGLQDGTEVETNWYLNKNLVSLGTLVWDGGESGEYLIWIEDANGLGRGLWRWELTVDGNLLGGGAFIVGGEPLYINQVWGVSFDPPASWKKESESKDIVTFASPDQRQALAFRVAMDVTERTGQPDADLSLFQQDHPDAQVVTTEEVTMAGQSAILQQVGFSNQDGAKQYLFIVSAFHSGSTYSLWILGPADDVAVLRTQLFATLRSIHLVTDE